jgi:hypothetical protein
VSLIRGHNRHALERTDERLLVGDRDLVVVARDNLLVVGVRALDEPRVDHGKWRAEADVILSAADLELFLGGK